MIFLCSEESDYEATTTSPQQYVSLVSDFKGEIQPGDVRDRLRGIFGPNKVEII
jgi:hypothetical protein